MAKRTLSILNGSGDTKLSWDPASPADVAQAREQVAALKEKGYQFFLTRGTQPDEVEAGLGELLVRRIEDPVAEPQAEGERAVGVRPMAGGA